MSSKKSFTLVELVMTIILVSILWVPLSLMVFQYIESYVRSENLTSSLQLIRLELETLCALNYEDINSATFSQYQGYPYDLERIVSYEYGGAASDESLKKIEVVVYYLNESEPITTIITYRAKNVLL